MSEVIDGEVLVDQPGREVALSDVDSALAAALTGVEIDKQIATARKFPRQLKPVTDRIFNLATLDHESAEENMYVLPRAGKPISGPSIRFAEILKQAYGNCRVAARVVMVDRVEKYVEAEGVFHDLETNTATSARVRRRIIDSKGRLYSDDMIIVTGNAACSIALRNAILSGVPKPLWRRAFEAVQATIKGDIKTLVERRGEAIKAFALFGVTPEQVFTALGVPGVEDVTLEHIPLLRGMFATLKNQEATVEEMFPKPGAVGGAAPTNTALTDRLKQAKGGEGAEGFNAAQAEGGKTGSAELDEALDGDQVPAEGGAKPPATDDFPGDRKEEPVKEEPKKDPPKQTLTQRVAAWKTLVDAETDTVAVMKLLKDNKQLLADVDRGDPDEVGTSQELEGYANDRCRQIEEAAS